MTTHHTMTTFEDAAAANAAIAALRVQGFRDDQIGLVMSEPTLLSVKQDMAEEGALAGGVLGAFLGAMVLVAAGPGAAIGGALVTLIGGTMVGGASGTLIGMLVGMGLSSEEAKRVEARVEAGEVVLAVVSHDPTRATIAEHILRRHTDAPVQTLSGSAAA